ncbi:MAG: response regulator, partial [Deltaproteobacteria bacterium]|nr:response regulator [Deltaproteobacteria bacterium]
MLRGNSTIVQFAVVIMMLCIPIMLADTLLAADPILLDGSPLDGQYIGKHIEYLSHQVLIDNIINDLDLDEAFREKVRTGRLVSDEKVTVDLKWTTTGYTAYFEYADGKSEGQLFEVGVNDLLRQEISSKFVPSQQRILSLKFYPRPYWLRFKVLNKGDRPVDFLLELDKHLFEYINVYVPGDDGVIMKRAVITTSLNQREIEHQHLVVKLSAEAGENSYYMFVNSWNRQTEDSVPLRIWSADNFTRHTSDEGLFRGIVVGLFLFIFFYNIFIYWSVRDPSYVFLALVTLCQMAVEMTVSGLGFRYLWPNNPLGTTQALFQTIALVMGFNLLFYRSFIGIARYTPRLDKALLLMSWLFFGGALSYFVLPQPTLDFMLLLLFIMDHLYSLPVLIPAIIAIKNRNRSGLFVLIGIFFYYLGLLKFGLTGSDIVQYGLLKYLPIKGLSFLIIMTLGLAHKFNLMKKSLVDLNINLERRVIERTEELQQANEKLRELDTFKNRMFANISHEFRTPLTLIIEPIKSLQKGDFGKLTKRSLDILSSMKRNADRLLRLISDFLDLSKIEAGRMNLNKRETSVSNLLSYCVSSLDSTAAGKGINVTFQDKTDGFQALIDPDLMEKVVLNLLSNAMKFNRPDGENAIVVTLEKETAHFRITVKDSGIGIPNDKLESVFDRFSQVDSSITRRHEGTGIGLSLTREIVELHDGEILVDSRLGEGSTFAADIPLVSPDVKEDAPQTIILPTEGLPVENSDVELTAASKTPVKAKGILDPISIIKDVTSETITILIVEDNDDMRSYLEGFLSRSYHTSTAGNGKEALEKLEKEKVDLVLSDLMMPEMDGYELTQSIR